MNTSITVNGVTYTNPLHAYQEQTHEIAKQMYLNHYDSYSFANFHDSNIRNLSERAANILLGMGVNKKNIKDKIEEDSEELFNDYYCSGDWSREVYEESQFQEFWEARGA